MTDDAAYQEFVKSVREDLIPKLENSALTVSLIPEGDPDIKFSIELGLSIMLDKPIIAVVEPGTKVPGKLVQVADAIIEGGVNDPTTKDRLMVAVQEILGDK